MKEREPQWAHEGSAKVQDESGIHPFSLVETSGALHLFFFSVFFLFFLCFFLLSVLSVFLLAADGLFVPNVHQKNQFE